MRNPVLIPPAPQKLGFGHGLLELISGQHFDYLLQIRILGRSRRLLAG